MQFESVFFRVVVAVVLVVRVSILLGAVGPFCEVSVLTSTLLNAVRVGILAGRSRSSTCSFDQYSLGISWRILQSRSSEQYSFGGSSDQYSFRSYQQ